MMSRRPFLAFSTMVVLTTGCADDVVAPVPAHTPPRPVAEVSAAAITTVMSGLNSPRGLSFGPEGGLYVAEAGTTQTTGSCVGFLEGATPATKCWSGTGSVSRL